MATVSSGAIPQEVVWAHAAGAPSNGTDDDTPVVQALLDSNKLVMFEPGRLFRFYTKLELSSMARLRSLGPGNSDGVQVTSSAKLVFTGSGSGCFVSKNPNSYLSHGGFNDLTVRAEGPYVAVFDLPNCVEMTWQNCTIETNNVNTGGIRGGKLPGLNAWINRIIACNWRLPDAGTSWVYDVNWSDSEVVASHFTGGLGSIDRGYGVSYIANQFERARYRGLRISKEYEAKQGNIIGNRFDANADVGLEIFVDDDNSTQTRIALSIVGNQFRTVSPTNPGVLGQADIRYTSKFTDRTYSILPPIARGCYGLACLNGFKGLYGATPQALSVRRLR
ncbi:hypothetical protein [Novosphingobium sp. AAP1]|uniref:hypothetical protein n=1 Tax=Novosphingobium sp. AAP1 TaxID=1523413 RepID=UPI000AF83E5D|nr:hypothetical protein [Novosphingobium sp. AAP1]